MFNCLPAKPNHFKNCAAICLVMVGLCLHRLSDKTRTMRGFTLQHHNGRLTKGALLMASLTVTANHQPDEDFFSPVRELSVSFERGDGNGKEFTMPFMWA